LVCGDCHQEQGVAHSHWGDSLTVTDSASKLSQPLEAVDAAPAAARGPDAGGQVDAEGQPESLRSRFLRPQTFISFGLALAILIFFVRRLDVDPGAIWAQVRQANPWLLAAAFAAWYGIFPLRAVRWKMMLSRAGIDSEHGYPVPGVGGIVEILLLSWFANCVVPAKLGDAYRCYLLKQDTKASFSTGLGTVAAERLIDLAVLVAMMTISAVVVFSGRVPAEAQQAFLLGLALVVIAAVGLAGMWFSRRFLQRLLPERIHTQYARLHTAIFQCLRRPEVFVGFSIVIWLLEGTRLWLVAASLQADLSPATALLIALMGSVLTTLPFTPAGLGVVELGLGAVLIQVLGVAPTMAASIILLDRVIGYWSLVLIGLLVLVWRTRREHKAGL
jgi:uncharacterized protein (TIRG00374 family)